MNVTEYNNGQYIKELNEIERYLMRIIQRYFDIEYNNTKESIEAIIEESLARLKQDLLDNTNYIFNFNQEVGNVVLTIQKFGGEPSFEKNTAFNKDFGNTADTVCEGNDSRLSDKRIPLDHIHDMEAIHGLRDRLESLVVSPQDVHKNKNILNMIRYAGTMAEIDLVMIEHVQKSINSHYENLENIQRECRVAYNRKLEELENLKSKTQKIIDRSQLIIQDSINWLDNAKSYTDRSIENLKNYYRSLLGNLITAEQLNELEEYLTHTIRFIGDGEFQLSDGTMLITQNQNNGIIAGNENGDSLKDIFDNGTRLGNDDWEWNEDTQSFVYQHDEINSYPMLLSLSKFKDYTHRVVLSSDAYDKGCISVIIAYDDETGNHLSLVISTGGAYNNDISDKPFAAIVFNYNSKNYGDGHSVRPIDDSLMQQIGEDPVYWTQLENNVPVLIKRQGNNIKVWIKYNEAHNWQENSNQEINPTEEPVFNFNLTSYPLLEYFMDKECRYGYGTFSQSKSTYLDVFLKARTGYLEPYGTTSVKQKAEKIHTIPSNYLTGLSHKRIKIWFKYQDNGKDKQIPLPYVAFKNNNWIVVQGTYDENGKIKINVNISSTLNGLGTVSNVNNNKLIIPIHAETMTYDKALQVIENSGGAIADSSDKEFIKQLISEKDFEYWINDNDNPVIINKNEDIKQPTENEYGYIVKYDISHLSDYFNNPRIYYQVYGERSE